MRASQPEIKEKNWRRAREEMEQRKYLDLRKTNQMMGNPATEMHLREVARKYANDSCRMAIRMRNETHKV